jgi:hypothetical protein
LQIEIKNVKVEVTKAGAKGYSTAFVDYLNEKGESKQWKLISFANPAVFDALKNAKEGDTYNITTGKNEKDFTVWVSATKSDSGSSAAPTKSAPAAAVRSTYETPEERATRQRLIVRQSSLSNAIEYTLGRTDQADMNVNDVLALADRFTAWVFEAPDLFDEPSDLPF